MIGAIAGDIIGSVWENHYWSAEPGFPLFQRGSRVTDDTVLTLAVAATLMNPNTSYEAEFRRAYERAPVAGFGGRFKKWAQGTLDEPYVSWGNGSAMRVSPVCWWFDSLAETEAEARRSALPTHGHPKGIQAAVVTAGMIFLARTGANKSDLKNYAGQRGYTLAIDPDGFKSSEVFLTAEFTTQAAILSVLESSSFEDCIRSAVLDDGDTDTQAAIAGSIAEAMYGGVPDEIEAEVFTRLKPWMTRILGEYRGQEV